MICVLWLKIPASSMVLVLPWLAHCSTALLCCLVRRTQMFERDEKRRVTIARIKEHRWYKKKVPEDLQLALDKIAEEQSQRVSTSGRRAGRALVSVTSLGESYCSHFPCKDRSERRW